MVQQLFIMHVLMEICNSYGFSFIYRECAQFLIQSGCSLLKNDSGNTPLRRRCLVVVISR